MRSVFAAGRAQFQDRGEEIQTPHSLNTKQDTSKNIYNKIVVHNTARHTHNKTTEAVVSQLIVKYSEWISLTLNWANKQQ